MPPTWGKGGHRIVGTRPKDAGLVEQKVLDAWLSWAESELPDRRLSADLAYKRALRSSDEAAWLHAEIVERGYVQLTDMLSRQDPYFSRIRGQMEDADGEVFDVDLRVHRYHRSEAFPLADGQEMLDISHLAPLADLVRNPSQQELQLTVNDKAFYQWPDARNIAHIRVMHCTVEDIELENNRVVRVAPRYGAIFEDRVRRRLQQSALPALDVLADVLDREQNAIINNRNPKQRLLILDGPAGTGKTVVAAHRIAVAASPDSPGIYLTPTTTLREYIQPVLPRLGLERNRARAWSLVDLAISLWTDFPWGDDLSSIVPDGPGDADTWTRAFETTRSKHPRADWETIYRRSAQLLGQTPRLQFGVEDVPGLLWMGAWARRPLSNPHPQWIIVDEAQAIPLLAYHALREWLGPKISWILAGDLMQQGSHHELGGWSQIQQSLKLNTSQVSHLWLRYSYRVPPNIHAAAERLRLAVSPNAPRSESVPWHSHAGQVSIATVPSHDALAMQIRTTLNDWQQLGITAVALLSPTSDRIEYWDHQLHALGVTFQVLRGNDTYRGGLILTSLDAVRGLEFDGVLLVDVNLEAYPKTPDGARKLYTSLTRSRRAVQLLSVAPPEGHPSPWLKVVENSK